MVAKHLGICAGFVLIFSTCPARAQPEASKAEKAAEKLDRNEVLNANRDLRSERVAAKGERKQMKKSKSKQERKMKSCNGF